MGEAYVRQMLRPQFPRRAFSYGLLTWCNATLDASVVALYGVLQPPVTCLFAFLIEGEAPSVWDGSGGLLIVLGLLAAARGSAPQRVGKASRVVHVSSPPAPAMAPLSRPLLTDQPDAERLLSGGLRSLSGHSEIAE